MAGSRGGVAAQALRALRRVSARGVQALDAVGQHLGVPVKWKDLRQAAEGLLGLLRLGPWGALALALFLATLAGFAAVLREPPAQRAQPLGTPAGLALLGCIAAVSFSLLLSGIRSAHPSVRFVAGLYGLWYLLLPPVLALPRWVALLPAWALYAVEAARLAADRSPPFWLIPWALLLGRLSPPLTRQVWASVTAWALLYATVGILLFRTVRRPLPERTVLFWSMAGVYAWGILQSPGRFGEALHMGYSALFTFLGLFWMWLAADLVDDASELAERAVGRLRRLLGGRWGRYGVSGALALVGGTSLLAALLPRVVLEALPLPVLRLVARFLQSAWTEGLAVCGALMVFTGAATWLRGTRDPADAAADGLASGVVLVLVYWAGTQAWAGLSEVEEPSGWWPLVLASAPVLLEEFKQTAKGVREGPAAAALMVVAVALLGIAATAFQFVSDPREAVRDTTLYPFLGMVLWGLPHLLVRLVAGWNTQVQSVRLFLVGYFSALPAALVFPDLRSGAPALAVLLWPLALRVSGRPRGDSLGLRAASGILLASGTLAFFYEPLPVPVPFAPWTDALIRRLGAVQATEWLSWAQLVAWLGAALAGAAFAVLGRAGWAGAALLWALWNRLFLR
ncbi:MAG: hypothetical protein QN133_00210 [Armatimonadota bacterium]|nr:hypothetical protein [Armatimonadota bacterium]